MEKKKRLTLSLDQKTIDQLGDMSKSLGLSKSAYVSFLVNSVYSVTTESSIKPEEIAKKLAEKTGKSI